MEITKRLCQVPVELVVVTGVSKSGRDYTSMALAYKVNPQSDYEKIVFLNRDAGELMKDKYSK